MLSSILSEIILFFAALLSGFYAGTGFFVAMGGNPAIKRMTDRTFAEYWQHTDHFMAERMKVFGPLLLLIMLAGVVVLLKEYRTPSFWLIMIALTISITDVAFMLSINHSLNQLVQSWDIETVPSNVEDIKWKIISAFNVRTIFMIGSFAMVLLPLWSIDKNA